MTNEITQRYAQGLFELAKENKSVEEKETGRRHSRYNDRLSGF